MVGGGGKNIGHRSPEWRVGFDAITIYDFGTMTNDELPFSVATILTPCPWGGDAALARVLAVLNGDGGRTLLVGGCVRNAVMGLAMSDYDLATNLRPEAVTARAMAAGLRAVPTGIAHGTVTVVADGRGFEVTTLRCDVETDGRRAVVDFTDDWVADAQRRDFTMNTLLADGAGHVYDPLGVGLNDARAGHVRFVGDPAARIAEDYLRILRFFRFQAHYGQGEMDADALAACAAAAGQIATLSQERITQEMKKWVGADAPVLSLRKAYEFNVLQNIFQAGFEFDVTERLVSLQDAAGAVEVMARLLALVGGAVAALRAALVLSRREEGFLAQVAAIEAAAVTPVLLRRYGYLYGVAETVQAVLWGAARRGGDLPDGLGAFQAWTPPVFPVTGDDLIARGVAPGPVMGNLLSSLKTKWLESDFQMTREDLLRHIP